MTSWGDFVNLYANYSLANKRKAEAVSNKVEKYEEAEGKLIGDLSKMEILSMLRSFQITGMPLMKIYFKFISDYLNYLRNNGEISIDSVSAITTADLKECLKERLVLTPIQMNEIIKDNKYKLNVSDIVILESIYEGFINVDLEKFTRPLLELKREDVLSNKDNLKDKVSPELFELMNEAALETKKRSYHNRMHSFVSLNKYNPYLIRKASIQFKESKDEKHLSPLGRRNFQNLCKDIIDYLKRVSEDFEDISLDTFRDSGVIHDFSKKSYMEGRRVDSLLDDKEYLNELNLKYNLPQGYFGQDFKKTLDTYFKKTR